MITHSAVLAYSLIRQHTSCLVHGQFRYEQRMVIVADKAKLSIGCSVLGKGLLLSLDYAAERLITPGARVVPAAIQVKRAMCEQQKKDFSLFHCNSRKCIASLSGQPCIRTSCCFLTCSLPCKLCTNFSHILFLVLSSHTAANSPCRFGACLWRCALTASAALTCQH